MTTNAKQVLKNAFVARYDKAMVMNVTQAYYGDSGFYNFGYWTPETVDQQAASEKLVSKLLDWLPEKTGTILDVACGMGATTKMVRDIYPPESIWAVNISPTQLGIARDRAEGCGFAAMDASHLGFADESFDSIICVEAAFHFTTRDDFLREAFRILKPGGRLVHSDILGHKGKDLEPSNYLANPEALGQRLRSIGFDEVEVLDTTAESITAHKNSLLAWPGKERKAGRISWPTYLAYAAAVRVITFMIDYRMKYYTLSSARKPLS